MEEIEAQNQEIEEWQKDNSNDSFDVWKIKQHINERALMILGIVIGIFIASRFFYF